QENLARFLLENPKPPSSLLKELERRTRKINALLREERLPEFMYVPLREWREDTQSAMRFHKRQAAQRGRKCTVLSDTVTALARYFWECNPLRDLKQADVYEYIRRLLGPFTLPICFSCGEAHTLADWRRVREWDQHRGPWETREARRQKARDEFFQYVSHRP